MNPLAPIYLRPLPHPHLAGAGHDVGQYLHGNADQGRARELIYVAQQLSELVRVQDGRTMGHYRGRQGIPQVGCRVALAERTGDPVPEHRMYLAFLIRF